MYANKIMFKIVHRHVALNITAPLYPIVHKNLMLASIFHL